MVYELFTPSVEGNVKVNDLLEYLKKKKLPKVVWISEDNTRITDIIEIDPKSNQLIGFGFRVR